MHKNLNLKFYRQDYYLLVIFIMMATAIVVKSYFNLDGYLSPDSTNYLTLAQNLLNGEGYYVSAYGVSDQDREFFAKWPAAYPTFIALMAKLTGLSLFWASKLLNIMLIGIILGILRALFKHNAYVYGLILLFSSYIEIFSYTWSETLFIAALLWFAVSVHLFMANPKKIIFLYFSIMIASLLLFMSRYIGAFSFGLIGLLGFYYALVKKDRTKALILITIAALNITIMFLYLHHNYIETGFITGMQRIASHETNLELFHLLQKAIFSEVVIITYTKTIKLKVILMYLIQMSVLFFLLWKYQDSLLVKEKTGERFTSLSSIFTIIALVYLFCIILVRWITQFDTYNLRLLGPGSFLLFIALISLFEQRSSKEFFNVFKGFIFFFTLLSFFFNVPYKAWEASQLNPNYFKVREGVKEKFKNIKPDSIVIFAPKHVNYLYTDIQIRRPNSFPYSVYKEKWLEFMERMYLKNKKNIYLFIPEKKLSPKEFDQSVIDFVNKYDEGTLVKLK